MSKRSLQYSGRPTWSGWIAAALYLGLLTALVFWPGPPLLERLRWLDSGICAQLPTHSFYPGGLQLPLCARNTGIYLGFAVTLITLFLTGRGRAQRVPPWPIALVLIGCVAAMACDGFNSFLLDLGRFHLYQPHNLLRLATGLGTGLAMALFVLPLTNYLCWSHDDERRSVASWQELTLFLPALVLCFFAVASQNSLTLYPVALLSTLGLLLAVASVNLLILIALSRRDQSLTSYREVWLFLSIAGVCAGGELLLLAQGKLILLRALGL